MPRRSKYTKELLEPLVKKNTSLAGVLRDLGLKTTGGNHRNIKSRIKAHNISMDHFKGFGWSKGNTCFTDERLELILRRREMPDELFFASPTVRKTQTLRRRLIRGGREYKCEIDICKLPAVWHGNKLTLHLDHINGEITDNRKENLRFLCPNCHQQTKTWGNKKQNTGA